MRATRRGNPILPWTAGAVLSLVVLALTVVDDGWLDRIVDRSPATTEPPTAALPADPAAPSQRGVPAEPDVATVAPPAALAPYAKSQPKIVPISPEGRGTVQFGTRPQPSQPVLEAPVPPRPVAPAQPDASAPRVVPISLERPQVSSSPAVQLVRPVAAEEPPTGVISDLGRGAAGASVGTDLGGVRLFIHYGASRAGDATTATRLAEYLRLRGFEVAGIRPVEFVIERPGVRYFFERDHAESERLLEDLGWFFRGQPRRAPERASDFTHYSPRPQPGTIEIWLPAIS